MKPSTSSTDEKRLEKDLRAHFKKLGQFREGQMPLVVYPSRLDAHQASDLPGKPSPHGKPGKPVLSKCWEPLPRLFHPQSIYSADARSTYQKAQGEAPLWPPPQGSQDYKPLQVEEGLPPLPVLPFPLSHLHTQGWLGHQVRGKSFSALSRRGHERVLPHLGGVPLVLPSLHVRKSSRLWKGPHLGVAL